MHTPHRPTRYTRGAVSSNHMPTRSIYNLTHLGLGVVLPVLFLTTLGLAAIYATDRTRASITEQVDLAPLEPDATTLAQRIVERVGPTTIKQIAYFLSGIVLLGITLSIGYDRIGQFAYVAYGIVLVLLVVLLVDRWVDLPFVSVRNNVRRWITLPGGVTLQPSEFMKVALLLTLARYLQYRQTHRTLLGLIPPFILTLVPMVLILRQPDLGTLLMLLPVLFAMLLVAGARFRHLAVIVLLGLATLPPIYFFGLRDYQQQRIDVVFKQGVEDERWHLNEGYQLRQAKIALGTGGLIGEGFGQGMFIDHSLLPEEHNDFIFAIIGHQFGLIGCCLVLLAYVVLAFFGMEVALVTNDPFGRLLAIGVIIMIAVQALLNTAMNVGLAPITGMPLPFVSAGGSSLWANFIALGLLLSVAQKRRMLLTKPPFEHGDRI